MKTQLGHYVCTMSGIEVLITRKIVGGIISTKVSQEMFDTFVKTVLEEEGSDDIIDTYFIDAGLARMAPIHGKYQFCTMALVTKIHENSMRAMEQNLAKRGIVIVRV